MKTFVLIFALSITSVSLRAQWLDGGRSQSQTVQSNGALLVDNGAMYLFNADNEMQKSTDNGHTWIELSDSGLPPKGPGLNKNVKKMFSSGGRIYAAMGFGNGSGMPFYSTDGGDIWLMDTLGAPGQVLGWGGLPVISDMHVWGHWVFINWDGPQMFDIKTFDGPYIRNQYMVTPAHNPQSLASHGDTLFVASGTGVYYTIDGGANFVTPANNGWVGALPDLYMDGSRLYVFTHKGSNPWTLSYSDDRGENWTPIDITTVMSQKLFGSYLTPQAAFMKGDRIEVAVDQAQFGTAPNVWKSLDRGQTWSVDTLGLAPGYVEYVTGFAYTPDGTLWAVRGHDNIYKQKIDAGTGSGSVLNRDVSDRIRITPNPCHDHFEVSLPADEVESVELLDMLGRVVKVKHSGGQALQFLPVDGLSKGLYWLRCTAMDGSIQNRAVTVE